MGERAVIFNSCAREVYSGSKTQIYLYEMEHTEEKKLPPQESRMLQGSASCRDLVPAPAASSSGEGLDVVLTEGIASERATIIPEIKEAESRSVSPTMEALPPRAANAPAAPFSALVAHSRLCSADTEILSDVDAPSSMVIDATVPENAGESWISIVEAEERGSQAASTLPEEMECEDDSQAISQAISRTAIKRKKSRVIDSDSVNKSASESTRRVKLRVRTRKRAIPIAQDQDIPGSAKGSDGANICSNPDVTIGH